MGGLPYEGRHMEERSWLKCQLGKGNGAMKGEEVERKTKGFTLGVVLGDALKIATL